MKSLFLPLLGASFLALSACGTKTEGDGNNTASKSGAMGDTATTTMPAGAADPDTQPAAAGSAATNGGDPNGPTAPHADDKEFMMSAAHSDQNEIQLSKMALAKGVTGTTKAYADKMIADHTKSTANLKPIAAKAGVTLPTDMDADHKTMAPAMEKLSGQAFEAKFLQQMVADHQKTANTLKAHETMTKNTALQGWITTTLPVVESHLTMASKDGGMKM
jgi:putative membrane protein